jgi:NhaC family Na+:H+ antiporter
LNKEISLFEAILPIATMLVCLTGGALLFPMGTELLIVVMLISAAVAGTIAVRYGHGWNAIQRSTGDKLASVLPALLILLSIGVLIGTWMFSGTIPMLVSFGIRLVNPEYMILTAFLVTAVMSLTGSSWASAGTIGVALMGVAAATGAPLAPTAGAVVSGAYFGDKLSPLSDSTNICAIGAKADLYDHIRNMVYTAGPSFVVALVVYFVASIYLNDSQLSVSTDSNQLLHEVNLLYQLNWVVFLPAIVVLYGTFTRKPAALTMVASSIVAMFVGVALHDFGVDAALMSAIAGFNLGSRRRVFHGEYTDPDSVGVLARGWHGRIRRARQITTDDVATCAIGFRPGSRYHVFRFDDDCTDKSWWRHSADSWRAVSGCLQTARPCT